MLVNSLDVLKYNQGFAPAINVPSLTALRAVMRAAEEEDIGVIIQHAESHENWLSREEAVMMMRYYAEKSSVPVSVHFDHGTSLEACKKAMQLGFTSVMYDGSKKNIDENIKTTREIVEIAKKYGVSVEAELGAMPDGDQLGEPILYTSVEEAERFVKETGVHMLAVSIGTAHGVYLRKPQIDFERIKDLQETLRIPLVMHGGSGLTEEEYKKSLKKGIQKINYYTYMSQAPFKEENMKDYKLFEEMEEIARNSMYQSVKKFMQIMKGC